MFSTSYFLYYVLTFVALLHQINGQTCDPGLDYHCVNETAFEYCNNGNVVPNTVNSCGPLYCQDGCEDFCGELNNTCVPAIAKTTVTELSSTTTELITSTTMTPEATTELPTEETSTTETSTTSMRTTTTTETSTEATTETATELKTTTMAATTTEVATELSTEETSVTGTTESTTVTMTTTTTTTQTPTEDTTATELTTITEEPTTMPPTAATSNTAISTAPTDVPPTEAPFICESAGEFQDLGNCSNFYLCIPLSSGDFVYIMFTCPDGSQFDSVTKKCSQNATCITPSCNDFGFYCISTSQVQFCYDSNPPSGDTFTCPTNTHCSMDCQYPCWSDIPCTVTTESTSLSTTVLSTVTLPPTTTESPTMSTTALPTSTVTLPPTTSEYPSTSTTVLPTSTITLPPTTTEYPSTFTTALPTSTATLPQTTTAAPFVCSEEGRFPDTTNCSIYYVCSPKSSGGFYTLHFYCPPPSLFDPSIQRCSSSFTCSTADTPSSTASPVVISTSRPFTCVESGRFPDPEDCKSYYLCSPKSSGGFYEMHYQCPPSSAYNQITHQCSTASSVTGNC